MYTETPFAFFRSSLNSLNIIITSYSMSSEQPEVWLRGPIPDIPALLQPAAQALLQAREDVHKYTKDFPEALLWEKPDGRASVGFHLQHLSGVLDRMLTYARGESLSEKQFAF